MNSTPTIRALALTASVLALTTGSTFAQQTPGTPGSPSSTTTIDGKYLPNPPAPFGGTINMDAQESKPYWPPSVVPPKGAPNVLLIMTRAKLLQGITSMGSATLQAHSRLAKAANRHSSGHAKNAARRID